MGKKVILFSLLLAVVEALIGVLGLFLHWFKQSFSILGLIRAMELEVWLLRAHVNIEDSDMCKALDAVAKAPFCDQVRQSSDIQEIQQRFCAPAIKFMLPDACEGLSSAYVLGMLVVMVFFLSLVMSACAVYLRHEYMRAQPKKAYRQAALVLDIVRLVLTILILLAYFPQVLLTLDSMSSGSTLNFALSASGGMGVGRGFMVMCLLPVVQLVMVILDSHIEIGEEAFEEEHRDARRSAREMSFQQQQQQQQQQMQQMQQQQQMQQMQHFQRQQEVITVMPRMQQEVITVMPQGALQPQPARPQRMQVQQQQGVWMPRGHQEFQVVTTPSPAAWNATVVVDVQRQPAAMWAAGGGGDAGWSPQQPGQPYNMRQAEPSGGAGLGTPLVPYF